jgi:hypothetical protein
MLKGDTHSVAARAKISASQLGKKRGPYKRTVETHEKALALRKEGFTYEEIGQQISVPWRTVCNWTHHVHVETRRESSKEKAYRLRIQNGHTSRKGSIRRYLLKKRGYRCEHCGLDKWAGEPIPLELHRKIAGGDYSDEANLELLCLNCHSLTPTWRNKKRPPAQIGIGVRLKPGSLE